MNHVLDMGRPCEGAQLNEELNMTSKLWISIIGSVALGQAGFTIAAGPSHPDSSEAGTVYHGPEYRRIEGKLARADVWNTMRSTEMPASQAVPDTNWEFVGGDSGWQLRPPRYEYRDGRFVLVGKGIDGSAMQGLRSAGR